jgi:hypothetical protein
MDFAFQGEFYHVFKKKLLKKRLSQNFSFWESNLRFRGKNGLWAVFSKVFPESNRVLGKAQKC